MCWRRSLSGLEVVVHLMARPKGEQDGRQEEHNVSYLYDDSMAVLSTGEVGHGTEVRR